MKLFLSKLCSYLHVFIIAIPYILRIIFYNFNKYDIYLLLFLLFVRLHWFFLKGECILSYIEKKVMLPNYKLGDDIFCSPWMELFTQDKTFDIFKEYYRNFTENLFIFFILYCNINSKNFNLLLLISIICIILYSCYNKLYLDYLNKRIEQNKRTITDLIIYN